MFFCFITKESEICDSIAKLLCENDSSIECRVYASYAEFDYLIAENRKIDLIICDYKLHSATFNLYPHLKEIFKKSNKITPAIFYNDPNFDDNNRVQKWIEQNIIAFEDKQDFDYLIPNLQKLNDILCLPDIATNVSLLKHSLPNDVSTEKKQSNDKTSVADKTIDINLYRRQTGMPPTMFKLFKFMYEHLNQEISVKQLAQEISKDNKNSFPFLFQKKEKEIKEATIYSYISRLKKYIEKSDYINIEIVRIRTGFYKMIEYKD